MSAPVWAFHERQKSKLSMSSFDQETCKKLNALIEKIDEERYDLEAKVGKADKEVGPTNWYQFHFSFSCRESVAKVLV